MGSFFTSPQGIAIIRAIIFVLSAIAGQVSGNPATGLMAGSAMAFAIPSSGSPHVAKTALVQVCPNCGGVEVPPEKIVQTTTIPTAAPPTTTTVVS